MSKPNLTVEEIPEGDITTFVVKAKLKYYGDTLLSRYEALFTETANSNHQVVRACGQSTKPLRLTLARIRA